MNEQIKRLLEQSGLQPYYDAQEGHIEKFAELLHRQVIASILITDVVMEEKGLTPTSEDYISAINKDFGVEE